MLFRYDFGEKLDLTKFHKQAMHYIGTMRELTYELVLPDYKIHVEIVTLDNSNCHAVSLQFSDIFRDSDKEITGDKIVIPLIDTRFKESKIIQELFTIDNYKAYFDSNSTLDTVDKLSKVIKLVHKINHLKCFL